MAGRGKLFDREGRLIVDNYPSVSCFLVREQNRNVDDDLPLIARGLNLDLDQLRATLLHYRAAPAYQPIPIKQDISADEQAFIEAHRNELPELETVDVERRLYPREGFAAHLFGYVGEVSEEDLNNPRYAVYEPGDIVGKAGVEETYDQLPARPGRLTRCGCGQPGREVGHLRTQHAIAGQDLKLTIDIDIQRAAELALGDRGGAVIAMDPRNGEILAMVSHPSYDPNAFAVHINRADWSHLITDPNHPLMNKAIQAQLAPGSTFKILMSVAGLQEGVGTKFARILQRRRNLLRPVPRLRPPPRQCGHEHAIPWSCDTFYYTLADKLASTPSSLRQKRGLGQRTGVDCQRGRGIVPSSQWKLKNYHEKWYVGETISVGIGQGA